MTGTELRAIRLKLGLTQAEFGRALAHEAPTCNINISQMEGGKKTIPANTARLAQALEILGGDGMPKEWTTP